MALTKGQEDEIIRRIAGLASYGKVISTTKFEMDSQFDDILELCRLYSGKITLEEYINAVDYPLIKELRSELINK
jgi:hypothetical protein